MNKYVYNKIRCVIKVWRRHQRKREVEQFGNLCANGFKISKQQFPPTGIEERNADFDRG